MTGTVEICRDLKPEERDGAAAMLRAAFGGEDEARLVEVLRADGDMVREAVFTLEGRLAGYAALSRMAGPAGWLCLAPVAVWPEFQRGAAAPDGAVQADWQVGRRLVTALVAEALSDGAPAVVVLGQPGFYSKCGFSRERAANLTTPYPLEYTLLAAPGTDAPAAELIYPAAFSNG